MPQRTGLRTTTPNKARRNEYRHQLNLISEAPSLAYAHDIAFKALIDPDLGGRDLSLEEISYRGVLRRVLLRQGGCFALSGMHTAANEVLGMHGPRRRVLEKHYDPPAGRRRPASRGGPHRDIG